MEINKKKRKYSQNLERIVKGLANWKRILILESLEKEKELTAETICEKLNIQYKTATDHLRRLLQGGLIWKKKRERNVFYLLTTRGKKFLKFLKNLKLKF